MQGERQEMCLVLPGAACWAGDGITPGMSVGCPPHLLCALALPHLPRAAAHIRLLQEGV